MNSLLYLVNNYEVSLYNLFKDSIIETDKKIETGVVLPYPLKMWS